ncbi:site-specific DNA-methyltransferase [Acidaminococcus intestini]|uniref:site-specific DNA-methyltransferase n=1 Tax=Acidaminococcus intestini TaxID=187327 RepID=UPI00242A9766|nr:site-specific DNA-methyltransferase [Acidaminococcus intestini]
MEKMNMHTPDLAKENYEKLAALFPNAVTETKDENGETVRAIDADVLRSEIAATVVEGTQERYQFTWPDKRKSVVLANQPIAKTLRLDREKSVGRDGTPGSIDTENIYIEGDNLDALKLLQETYLGKVKMIYIDPPYNTGSDAFVYDDDSSISGEEFAERSGQRDDDGNLLFDMRTNNESNGRFHTDWLNMLYPRLRIAKDLLSDDGVIFISIDDYEQENLKKICSEIFGAENFIAQLVWERAFAPKNDAKYVSNSHDYVLMFAKKIDNFKIGRLPSRSLSKNAFLERLRDNRIWFGADGNGVPRLKRFLSELKFDGMAPTSIMFFKDVGHNQEGAKEVAELLEGGYFSGPKPVRLLRRLLTLANLGENDIVLDFFSGSATTAHAVMQMNSEDGSNRKFILVQLPEVCDEKSEVYKAGYRTICEIGEERIRRAGKKIKEESPLTTTKLDIGFRVFKVDSSNMEDVYYRPADVKQAQLDLFADNIKPDRTPEDLLFQVMLDLGITLSSSVDEEMLDGRKVFSVADGYLIACFDKDVTDETVKAIAKRHPFYAVFRDSGMANDSVMANFEQIFETYSPQTQRKVL